MNTCLFCGKPVTNKFCNVSCQNRYYKRKPTKEQYKQSQITRYGKLKEYKVICYNCSKEFSVFEKEKLHPKKEKYFCSRSCANTRHHDEETKSKISKSIINLYDIDHKKHIKLCKYCNKEFETTKETRQFCSSICARKNNIKLALNGQQEKIKNDPEWWSQIQKNLYANGHQYVAGGTTKWYLYKGIKVQGTYELRTCFILDKWKEEGKIKDWEYTNDRISYIGLDNKQHSYLLDFKVFDEDGSFYYVETKGYKKDNDELKWKTVQDKGFKLEVWFEKDIIKNENKLNI